MTEAQTGSFSIIGPLFAGTLKAAHASLAQEPLHATSPLIGLCSS